MMGEERKVYVAGFLFSEDRREVLLIQKNRPDWQKGRMNAVGGKVESGETPDEAMRREFREEAGLDVGDWRNFVILKDERGWSVWFYYAFGDPRAAVGRTDEQLIVAKTSVLPFEVLPNLRWLIPMAFEAVERTYRFDVDEVSLSEEAGDRRLLDFAANSADASELSDEDLIDACIEEIGVELSVIERPSHLLSELTDRFMEAKGIWRTPKGYLYQGEEQFPEVIDT